jgi:hypothetical protein
MTRQLPSLAQQTERWNELFHSRSANYLRRQLEVLVTTARQQGLRIEITQVPDGPPRMGGTREVVQVIPSRDGYQSTT